MLKNKYTIDAAIEMYNIEKKLYDTLKEKLGKCDIPVEDEGIVLDTLCELRRDLTRLNGIYGKGE